jgi:hypothetical protein
MPINTTVNHFKLLSLNYIDGLRKTAPKAIVDTDIKGTNHSLRHSLQSLAEFTQYSTKYYSFASFLVGQSSDKFTDIFKSVSNQSNVERPPACYTGAITRTSWWEGTRDYLFTVILPVEQKFQLSFSLLLFTYDKLMMPRMGESGCYKFPKVSHWTTDCSAKFDPAFYFPECFSAVRQES